MKKDTGARIPAAVCLRTYAPHALVAALSLLSYVLLFALLLGGATRALAEMRRVDDAPHNEIVLANEPNGEATMIYLKNHAVRGATDENAVSDLFMLLPDRTYHGDLYFEGTLAPGTCAVSANIAARYGLTVGREAVIMANGLRFTVTVILPAQGGIDPLYEHEGVILLSYDEALLDRTYAYVSFTTDGDGYRSLSDLIYTEDLRADAVGRLLLPASVAALSALGLFLVCEIFLFGKRRADYAVLVSLGIRGERLLAALLAEHSAKYILPALIAAAVFLPRYACYGEVFYTCILVFAALCAALSILLSLADWRRTYYVRAK